MVELRNNKFEIIVKLIILFLFLVSYQPQVIHCGGPYCSNCKDVYFRYGLTKNNKKAIEVFLTFLY